MKISHLEYKLSSKSSEIRYFKVSPDNYPSSFNKFFKEQSYHSIIIKNSTILM